MRNNKGQFIKGSKDHNMVGLKLGHGWNKNKKGWTIGTKAGFQKGHPPYNNKLTEWREKGGVSWNKGTKGKGICKPNSGSFKKGDIPYMKGKKFTKESIKKRTDSRRKSGWWKNPKKTMEKKSEIAKKNGNKPPLGSFKGFKHSEKSKKENREWHINNPNKIFKDTTIELKVEEELKKRNINYQKQVPLCKIAIVDFYLPEYRVIIQCDGDYWHNLSEQKERDEQQDRILIFNGFNVYRFWEHEINESVENCINQFISDKGQKAKEEQ